MTLKEACKKAVETDNIQMVCAVANQLRNMGFDYEGSAHFFAKCAGINRDDFENLMYRCDTMEAE